MTRYVLPTIETQLSRELGVEYDDATENPGWGLWVYIKSTTLSTREEMWAALNKRETDDLITLLQYARRETWGDG